MKTAALMVLITALALAIPYVSKTYGLKPISVADLPPEGGWATLSEGQSLLPMVYAQRGQEQWPNPGFDPWFFDTTFCLGWS